MTRARDRDNNCDTITSTKSRLISLIRKMEFLFIRGTTVMLIVNAANVRPSSVVNIVAIYGIPDLGIEKMNSPSKK